MKVTIEIPSSYYEGDWVNEYEDTIPVRNNRSQEIIDVTQTGWNEFAFEMANLITRKFRKMSDLPT